MKKRLLLLVTLLVASVLFVPNAYAASVAPETLVVGEETVFIANGNKLTITAATTEGMGATVTWDGGSVELPADAWVFGGMHNDTSTTVSSDITMEGGQLYAIVGGGLHASTVDNATIIVNGGTLKSVYGGGVASSFFDAPTDEERAHDYTGDASTSTTKVENASITINDGTITKYIYGGGMGYNYTKETTITINGGDQSTALLTAGGANGYTGASNVIINDGNLGMYQSVNRGTVNSANAYVNGGTVGTIYVGGEPDKNVTGTITTESIVVINDGTVTTVNVGTNGGETTPATDVAILQYNTGTITNPVDETTFKPEKITELVTLTFTAEGEEESVQVPLGTVFTATDVETLKADLVAELVGTGYTFDDFYTDETFTKKFDLTQPLNADAKVYMKLVEVVEDNTKNPETSDIGLIGIIATIILAGAGLGYTIKKRKFN